MSDRETNETENIVISWERYCHGGEGYGLLRMLDEFTIMRLFHSDAFVKTLTEMINERGITVGAPQDLEVEQYENPWR
jgi:hypothetical protein